MSDLQFAKNTASCAFVKRRIGLEYNFTATSKIDKGLSIYYVIRNWGGVPPDLLQYYIGGGLPNLLQYYIGEFFKVYYNITDLVGIWKGLDLFQYHLYVFMLCAFCLRLGKFL